MPLCESGLEISEKLFLSKNLAKVLILVTLAPTISPYFLITLLIIDRASMPSSVWEVRLKVGLGKTPREVISKPSAIIGAGKKVLPCQIM